MKKLLLICFCLPACASIPEEAYPWIGAVVVTSVILSQEDNPPKREAECYRVTGSGAVVAQAC